MPGVTIDLSKVRAKLSQSNFERGQYVMANQMLVDMNENFVPLKEGDLRASGHVGPSAKQLIWTSAYARKHYYAPGNWTYTTPGTGPRWDEKASGMFLSDWIKSFTKGAGL